MGYKIDRDTPVEDVVKAAVCKKGCTNCRTACRQGSGAFVDGELERLSLFLNKPIEEIKGSLLEPIRRFNTTLLRPRLIHGKNSHSGRCIFLTDDGCSIYPVRPLECKISAHGEGSYDLYTWFIVNHLVRADDPQSIREYSRYIESNNNIIDGGKITDIVKDEELLRKILRSEIL